MLRDPHRGRPRQQRFFSDEEAAAAADDAEEGGLTEEELEESERGYIDLERHATADESESESDRGSDGGGSDVGTTRGIKDKEESKDRTVDVVLSDMSAPWEQTSGFYKRSLSEPYSRMMNTSGISFRDHAGSMVRLLLFTLHVSVPTSIALPTHIHGFFIRQRTSAAKSQPWGMP